MGAYFYNNNKINQEHENIEEKSMKKNIDLNLLPNPNFQNNKIILKSHQYSKDIFGNLLSCYEIYNLCNIKNAFYIAYIITDSILEISKYDFNIITKIMTINIESKKIKKIKYFYDEFFKKEYLIIQSSLEIVIFSIISEDVYKRICIYSEEGYLSRGDFWHYKGKLPINDFIIFNNIYNKKNYLVILYFYLTSCDTHEKKISLLKLENNNLKVIKEIIAIDSSIFTRKIFLLWEDKISKSYYIIYNSFEKLVLLKIDDTNNKNLINIDKLFPSFGDFIGCIVNNKNKKDYLYLININGLTMIIDLNLKEKIKEFTLFDDIKSIINWNNKYLIFSTNKNIYVFDIEQNKIINKISFNSDKNIISINKFLFEELNLYSLIIEFDNKEIIMKC